MVDKKIIDEQVREVVADWPKDALSVISRIQAPGRQSDARAMFGSCPHSSDATTSRRPGIIMRCVSSRMSPEKVEHDDATAYRFKIASR